MMTSSERNNYFKLVAFIVDIACHVIWRYIREKIVGSNSFQSILDRKEEKHKLIHIYETSQCCECVSEKIKGERLISKKQLLLLYKSDKTKQTRDHIKYVGGKMTQICICNYSAIENIDVNVVDITLANYIIQKCGKNEPGMNNWIEQIKDVRNKIFHLSDIQKITNTNFDRKWTKLEGSLVGIANLIDSVYAEETTKKITKTKKTIIIPDYMLKYEILCREYWRNKCAEFERIQMQDFEKKATALQYKIPELVSGGNVTDCKRTMQKIQTFSSMVDKINILTEIFCKEDNIEMLDVTELDDEERQRVFVPVFLQLEVPKSWEKNEIFEVIDEMRLKGASDMHIRIKAISTDDFSILAEIANSLLHNVHILRSEINQMMSAVLSEAAIITSQAEQVCVSIHILDNADSEPPKSYFQFDVRLRQKLQRQSGDNYPNGDCLICNDQLVFTDCNSNILSIYDIYGNFNRDIKLSNLPHRISVINENEVAVSYKQKFIDIVDITSGQMKNRIATCHDTLAISYQNGLMYAVTENKKIDVMNMTGEIVQSIQCYFKSLYISLLTDTDILFFTDPTTGTLYCCDLYESVKWKFTDDMINWQTRITTDGEGNVYVSCAVSNIVLVVSSDGKHHKELLTEKDGLQNPTGIYYNKSNDCLLVCNGGNCDAFIFDVKHSAIIE